MINAVSIKGFLKKKSVIALILLLLAGGGYAWYRASHGTTPPKYILTTVTRGSVIQNVSGSGQVSGVRQFDVKPTVSAKILKINVKPGDQVTTSTVIAELDKTDALKTVRDAQQSVRDAELSLQSQQLSYEKQKLPPDASAVLQAQNAVNQAQRDLDTLMQGADQNDIANAKKDIQTQQENSKLSYDGVLSVGVRNAYDNAVGLLKGVAKSAKQGVHDGQPIIQSNDPTISNLSPSKLIEAVALSYGMVDMTNKLDADSSALPTTGADPAKVDAIMTEASDVLGKLVPYLQKLDDALLNTVPSASYSASAISTLKGTFDADLSDANSRLSAVISQTQSINQAKTSYATTLISLQKAQDALAKLLEPPKASDVTAAKEKLLQAQTSLKELTQGLTSVDQQIALNSLQQRQSALASARSKLADAQTALGDYSIKAPFQGAVANIAVSVADQASPSTAIATIVTTAKIAEMSLNEVDAAKVATGQKATLTFDAVPNTSVAGVVTEVNPVGTVSQGVVNYSIKIAFETQDDRIKAGMSVSAKIVTLAKTDVLTLPNGAIHTSNGVSSVDVLSGVDASNAAAFTQGITSATLPQSKSIEIGIANDQVTEITSGLNENDIVVLRTVTTSKTSTASKSSSTGIPGVGGFGGGAGGGTSIRRAGG